MEKVAFLDCYMGICYSISITEDVSNKGISKEDRA